MGLSPLPLFMIVNMRFGFYMTQKHQYLQDNVVHHKDSDRYRSLVGSTMNRYAMRYSRSGMPLIKFARNVLYPFYRHLWLPWNDMDTYGYHQM